MKQVILVRTDLKIPKGKLSVQVSHASVEATLKSDQKTINSWRNEGMKKVVLKVKDEKELLEFKRKAERSNLKTALIKDSGKTFFKEPTITCLAIGPDKEDKIDKLTRNLKML